VVEWFESMTVSLNGCHNASMYAYHDNMGMNHFHFATSTFARWTGVGS
jgi:hypothetical protein